MIKVKAVFTGANAYKAKDGSERCFYNFLVPPYNDKISVSSKYFNDADAAGLEVGNSYCIDIVPFYYNDAGRTKVALSGEFCGRCLF